MCSVYERSGKPSPNVVKHATMAGECRTDFYTSELKKFNSCRAALKELVYEDSDEAKKHLFEFIRRVDFHRIFFEVDR